MSQPGSDVRVAQATRSSAARRAPLRLLVTVKFSKVRCTEPDAAIDLQCDPGYPLGTN